MSTATLRQEIDLDQLRDRFLTVIQHALRPYSVSLWIRTKEQRDPSDMLEEIVVADDDPLLAYMLRHSGTLEIDRLHLDSPILIEMKSRSGELLLPLTNQGELPGLLLLGPHLKGEVYTPRERGLLASLIPQNELLCADTLPSMFVTCFYALLDPISGKLRYANAGHDPPYCRSGEDVCELYATGMPPGLLPGMHYEEKEALVTAGERILLYSDGLVESHNPDREMFGFPRLKQLIVTSPADTSKSSLIDFLLQELKCFTGEGWEQEDDVTLVVLERTGR